MNELCSTFEASNVRMTEQERVDAAVLMLRHSRDGNARFRLGEAIVASPILLLGAVLSYVVEDWTPLAAVFLLIIVSHQVGSVKRLVERMLARYIAGLMLKRKVTLVEFTWDNEKMIASRDGVSMVMDRTVFKEYFTYGSAVGFHFGGERWIVVPRAALPDDWEQRIAEWGRKEEETSDAEAVIGPNNDGADSP